MKFPRMAAYILFSLTFIPLQDLFYYIPYFLDGRSRFAFYDFGGSPVEA